MNPLRTRLSKYAWFAVVYNIFVVLWGALVRATGSGAGCGSHWPLCNGEVIPRADALDTAIEFTHRVTSGLAFLIMLGLLIWVIRNHPKSGQIRFAAWGAMVFMISESLVGAGLVIFEWVGGNISAARVIVMGVHLANTMLLLFFLTFTAWYASGGGSLSWVKTRGIKWLLLVGFMGVLLMSMAGAVTALGDTLFPVETLAEGLEQDLSPSAHFIVRLRVWHPFFAVAVGLYLYYLVRYIRESYEDPIIKTSGLLVLIIFGVQLGAGALNLVLLVPVWMQIVHLFLATLVWIGLALLTVSVLRDKTGDDFSGGNEK